MSLKKDIFQQLGYELAGRKCHGRGFLTVYRPNEVPETQGIKYYGTIGDMLASGALAPGAWIIEFDLGPEIKKHLVRWNEPQQRWDNMGEVAFGVL